MFLELVQDPTGDGFFANRGARIVNDLKCEDANPGRGTVHSSAPLMLTEGDLQRCAVEKDAESVANLNRCEV